MITDREPFGSPDLTPLDFCLWGWMKSEVYKINLDTPDELFARILDVGACIQKREDQLRRTTRDLRKWLTKRNEFEGAIFENLWAVTIVSFLRKKCHLHIKLKLKLINNKQFPFPTTHNASVFVYSNSSTPVNIQCSHELFLDTITFKNSLFLLNHPVYRYNLTVKALRLHYKPNRLVLFREIIAVYCDTARGRH